MKRLNKNHLLLLLILTCGFLVRFYGFANPIADWHSWRQSETSAVSRNFVQKDFDLLHPKMDNISNVQSGKDNPEGYFFVEFPIYNALQAGAYILFGVLTIEQWGRLVSMIASVFSGLFLYLIVTKHSTKTTGLFSAFFFMFIPFNIYYGRTILPESTMVMAVLGGIYFFNRYAEGRLSGKPKAHPESQNANKNNLSDSGQARMTYKKDYIFALLFTTAAFLLKPYALFFVLPIVYLAFKHFGLRTFLRWELWLFAVLSVAPLLAWRTYMTQFPEGIPANQWLFNGNGIRFRPSFFRWIFYERLTILISGYFGIILLALGVLKLRVVKDWLFFAMFALSSLLYVSVIATGNVQHDYYQIAIMPTVAIFFAIGSTFLLNWKVNKLRVGIVLLGICMIGGIYFGWMRVRDYFNINNHSIISAGQAVQRLTPQDAKIVANYNGDSSLLYQMNRKGWASFQDPMPILIQKGADYLVLVNPTPQDMEFQKTYKLIEKTNEYAIFDLKNK